MTMFVKNADKITLEATFEEAIKIKKNIVSLKGNPREKSSKNEVNTKTKTAATKSSEENKDIDSMDMESL
jgi:hypothetical protein